MRYKSMVYFLHSKYTTREEKRTMEMTVPRSYMISCSNRQLALNEEKTRARMHETWILGTKKTLQIGERETVLH